MDERDKELFFFDMSVVEWPSFILNSIYGIRTYLMKEDPKTIPRAIKRLNRYDWFLNFEDFCEVYFKISGVT